MLEVGDRVGRWRVEEPLHWSGAFHVYRCVDEMGTCAIVKLVPVDGPADVVGRAEREVAILGRLAHPTLPQLLDHGVDEAHRARFLAVELVEGRTLAGHLKEVGPLDPEEARAIFGPIADGLAYAHRAGVVHRDVRPGTLVLTEGVPRLAELGVARMRDDTRLTTAFGREGALAYLPPEYFGAERVRDFVPADVYALGVTLWEALVGRRAFPDPDGPPVARVQQLSEGKLRAVALDPGEGCPPGLRGLVRRATAPRPEDRLTDLDRFATWSADDATDLAAPLPSLRVPDRATSGEPERVSVRPGPSAAGVDPRLTWFLVGVTVAGLLTVALVAGLI